jgi:hypothetical protein
MRVGAKRPKTALQAERIPADTVRVIRDATGQNLCAEGEAARDGRFAPEHVVHELEVSARKQLVVHFVPLRPDPTGPDSPDPARQVQRLTQGEIRCPNNG